MEALTKEQILELYRDLQVLEKQLSQQIDLTSESARPVDLEAPIGRLSRMDAMQNQQMAKANQESAAQRIERVRAAIQAFADGSYAFCATCQRPIGYARLKAIPETTICVDCS